MQHSTPHPLGRWLPILAGWLALSASAPAGAAPRLAVLIVVDQLSYEMLNRLRPAFTDGLRMLDERGVSFENTRHAHACTLTFPGHAALATGVHLGQDEVPDLLGISLSALDIIGHRYGPNSAEMVDTVLRLDRCIGAFLRFLDQRVGAEHLLVSLTSDHGVQPLPEHRRRLGLPGHRLDAADVACVQQAARRVAERSGNGFRFSCGAYLDPGSLHAWGTSLEALDALIVEELEDCPSTDRVFSARELRDPASRQDPEAEPYRNCYHPDRSPDYFIRTRLHHLAVPVRGTSHGSPHPHDTHVPWVVLEADLPAARIRERIATVDVAPTIASLLGVKVPEDLDGVDRTPLLRRDAGVPDAKSGGVRRREEPPRGSLQLPSR